MSTLLTPLRNIGESTFTFKKAECRHEIVKGIISLESNWKTAQQIKEITGSKKITIPLNKSLKHLSNVLQSKTYTEEKEHLHSVITELRVAVDQANSMEDVSYAQCGHLQIMLAYTWLLVGAKNDARTYFLHAQKNYQKLNTLIQEELHEVNLLIKYPNISKTKQQKSNNDFLDVGLDVGLDLGIDLVSAFIPGAGLAKYAKKIVKSNVLEAIEGDSAATENRLKELVVWKNNLTISHQEIEQYVDFLQDILYILPSIDTTTSVDKVEAIKKVTKNAFSYSTSVVGSLKETVTDEKLKTTVTGFFKRAPKNNDSQ